MTAKRKGPKYEKGPAGDLRVVEDFLPSPEELAFKEDTVKVTISLSRRSVDFFKKRARRNRTRYQRMIRRLLDAYVTHHQAQD